MKLSVRWPLSVVLAYLCFSTVTPAWAQTHVLWVYRGGTGHGFFEDLGGGNWKETDQALAIYSFQEVSRTSKLVTLYDSSRDLYAYIEKRTCSFQVGSGPVYFLYSGRWVVIKPK